MIGTYQPGTPIEVVEVLPDYVGINYKNGVGYVLRHRIGLTYEAEAENVKVEDVIEDVLRQINVP